MTTAQVKLWGKTIGTVALPDARTTATFAYAPDFVGAEVEPAPLTMPVVAGRTYSFPHLPTASFYGLPGLLADSLPDKFGNRIISRWLAREGRSKMNAIERLCYTGHRGMGALEYHPAAGPGESSADLDIDNLVQLANSVLNEREDLSADLQDPEAMSAIVQVGTSAGGARAKAVVAWNRKTNQMRSGQLDHGKDWQHWLLKFDGVDGNGDREGADPQGFGVVEYAYHLMALAAGIQMAPCELLARGDHRHFLTKRFDRIDGSKKLHMQSLAAMKHFDFKDAGAESYESAMFAMTELGLPIENHIQLFIRAVLNVLARNQDDHVKNIAFLMDMDGQWSLSPAYDVTFAFNPNGRWTGRHQMSINGKLGGFTQDDLLALASAGNIKQRQARSLYEDVRSAVSRWPEFAAAAGVSEEQTSAIGSVHRVLAH